MNGISPATGSPAITRPPRPVGVPTRGTTNANRLRRADRWMVNCPRVRTALESATAPVIVDLGYGRLPVTTLELATRLRAVRPDVRVVGLEIDPQRVVPDVDGVEFRVGGFELAGLHPVLVRAFNVLRQYPEEAVDQAWTQMRTQLAPGGLIVDGTCDELGRRCCWVLLDRDGPVSLTLACDPGISTARPTWPSGCRKCLSTTMFRASRSTTCCRRRTVPGRAQPGIRCSDRVIVGARCSRNCGRPVLPSRRSGAPSAMRCSPSDGRRSRRT